MFPGVVGPVEDDDERVRGRGDPVEPVLGELDDGDQLRRVLVLAAQLAEQVGSEGDDLAVRTVCDGGEHLPRPAGGRSRLVVQEGPDPPPVLDRERDRSYALDDEGPGPMPLGAIRQERLPLLVGGVPGGDPGRSGHGYERRTSVLPPFQETPICR